MMSRPRLNPTTCLTSNDWLDTNLNNPNLIILDASVPSINSTKSSEPSDIRIPGARFFDLKKVFSDPASDLPAMLPSPEAFEQSARELGINQNSQIVIYDNLGIYSSPRAWWMFRAMGHEHVAVLDGGLPEWKRLGFPMQSITGDKYEIGDFKTNFQPKNVSLIAEVTKTINNDHVIVIDARGEGRFNGTAPEPREGLRSGSIPNSINLPFGKVLQDGKMLPKAQLQSIFKGLEITDQKLIFTCGSGVTACIILLAAEVAGLDNLNSVYDGAWCEWASIKDR